jgi:hypothetical protein
MWLLEDAHTAESATCPRCRRTHQTKKLRHFVEESDREAARQARSALLAKRDGNSAAFADTAHVAEMEQTLADDSQQVTDDEYLSGVGIDPDTVESAAQSDDTTQQSRPEIVRSAISSQDTPTDETIISYATNRGVPADATHALLEKLTQKGELTKSNGVYRLL